MKDHKAGDRVGALMSMDADEAHLLGYGVYQGDQPCPVLNGRKNPCILLDNGDMVWGCQCWWGSEQGIKDAIDGKKIKAVRMSDYFTKPPPHTEEKTEDEQALSDILKD